METITFKNGGKNIREIVINVTNKFADKDAFKIKKNFDPKGEIYSVSFKEYFNEVKAIGTALLEEEMPESKIGITGENTYNYMRVFLGATTSGFTAVPFDKGFTKDELSMCITRSNVTSLFCDYRQYEVAKEAVELVKEAGFTAPKLTVITGPEEQLSSLIAKGEEYLKNGSTKYDEVTIDEESIAVILFTSGTTSTSKAVLLRHRNIAQNILSLQTYEIFYPEDVNMAFLPFHHSFGLVGFLVFYASGCSSVFCDGLRYITKNLKEYAVTVFVGVPLLVENMHRQIMRKVKKTGKEKTIQFGFKLCAVAKVFGLDIRRKVFAEVIDGLGGALRLIISGAAPVKADALSDMNRFGILTLQGYGLTETSPVLAAENHVNMRAGSVGKALPNITIKIDNPDESGIGEIIAQGPNVMKGYLDMPEETAEAIQDGWFHTGDLGIIDKDGFIFIKGRKKNVIVMKNGKNIFPEEIEDHIAVIPYVSESMVFTREKHNDFVLLAEVTLDKDTMKEEGVSLEQATEAIRNGLNTLNTEMASYKRLHGFIVNEDDMIKTTTGKVKRNPEVERLNSVQETEKYYDLDVTTKA